MAVLKVIAGSCPGQIIELHGERCTLGRLPSCQIVLENGAVSRTHAQILESHGAFYLEDLRSRNGTQINGEPIQGKGRVELHHRDIISVCEVELRFLLKVAPDDSEPARPVDAADAAAGTPNAKKTLEATDTSPRPKAPSTPRPPELVEDGEASSISSSFDVRSPILEITDNLGGSLDIDVVLPRILESLFKIFPQADRGVVVLQDPSTGDFQIKAFRLRREGSELDSARISTTILREAIDKSKAVLCSDAAKDPRFLTESIANLRIRSFICVPLPCRSLDVRGAIQLDTFSLAGMFSQDDLDLLASVCTQAALALDNVRMHQAAIKQRDLERELEFATQVQLGFLPSERPLIPGYSFCDHYSPAQRVGGDFFDYVALPGGRTAITVGDVAGKGVPAALLMARMYSDVRYTLLSQPTPADAVTKLNEGLSTGGLGHRFITFALLVLDPSAHTLTIVNAGHLPPLLRSKTNEVKSLGLNMSGLPLGIQHDLKYRQTTVKIAPGETVLLYTDGVTEAMNHTNECYGSDRLAARMGSAGGDVAAVVEAVIEDVESFGDGLAQRDDICLLCFERHA
ncbi:MAG: SpoIIE family protein phosphatase [Planctomycetota bacterium]|nr:SpoIIE family protein phosphatase [Planctomycetota bacterium]